MGTLLKHKFGDKQCLYYAGGEWNCDLIVAVTGHKVLPSN